ncbi:MAG: FAD-dependent oxidoreductase [Alphaproteobacteria bacterium]|nr:FAD-dependent oxidoreductase [Alphaproteobacteria bacterium]
MSGAASSQFPKLFSPLHIGQVELKNRIFFPAHHTNLTGAVPTPELAAYYEARARGGTGLVIAELACVYEPGGVYSSALLMATSDECIAGYRTIAERCHAHGCKVFAQLFHPGREIRQSPDGGMSLAYAPSAAPTERFRVTPAPFKIDMIGDLVSGFGDAAKRLEEAGIDGIELIVGFGFVLSQFLNPRVNQRSDRYGGSFANRMRIVEEIIADIRHKTSSMVLGVRVSADERSDEGLSADEMITICKAMEQTGEIDYFNVSDGAATTVGGAAYMVPSMALDHTGHHAQVQVMRGALSKPILMAGRINQPQLAETLLQDGHIDMCGMARPLIADAEFANKAQRGEPDQIRACVACNQSCIGRVHKGATVSCIQNPVSGRELDYGRLAPAQVPKDILVIGAGPAGLKAAVISAERGHNVRIWEREPQAGGQVMLAQQLPGRSEFGGIVTNLLEEIRAADIEIICNREADPSAIAADPANAVIIASGARARPAAIDRAEGAHVVSAWQVVEGKANVGASVVVYDWLADWTGLGVAEKLARDGCSVTLAVNGYMAGEQLPVYTRDPWIGELHRLGVTIMPYARLYGVDGNTVYLQHTASGEPMLIEGVDTLVTSMGALSDGTLREGLAGLDREIHFIGDCVAPRSCEEVILEGLKIGAEI